MIKIISFHMEQSIQIKRCNNILRQKLLSSYKPHINIYSIKITWSFQVNGQVPKLLTMILSRVPVDISIVF